MGKFYLLRRTFVSSLIPMYSLKMSLFLNCNSVCTWCCCAVPGRLARLCLGRGNFNIELPIQAIARDYQFLHVKTPTAGSGCRCTFCLYSLQKVGANYRSENHLTPCTGALPRLRIGDEIGFYSPHTSTVNT